MKIERTDLHALVVNKLPDGSRLILDPESERVFSLNSTAGAVWDACSTPTTLARLTESMQHSFNPAITKELAEEAVLQLQEQKLVKTSGSQPNRRQFFATLGLVALPLVVSLTMADQRAYADVARSTATPPCQDPPVTPPSDSSPPSEPPPSNPGSPSGPPPSNPPPGPPPAPLKGSHPSTQGGQITVQHPPIRRGPSGRHF